MTREQQLIILTRKELAVSDGLELLTQTQKQLAHDKSSANAWGLIGLTANATLIPLNVIIKSCELKNVNSLYQIAVKKVYDKFASSGSRIDGHAASAVSHLKTATVAGLKLKGLTDYVPGVNVLFGLVQDTMALWHTATMVSSGNSEMDVLTQQLDKQISRARQQLLKIKQQEKSLIDSARANQRSSPGLAPLG